MVLTDKLILEIKARAVLFCLDNIRNATPMDSTVIEAAMLIGAALSNEFHTKQPLITDGGEPGTYTPPTNPDGWIDEYVMRQQRQDGSTSL